VMSDRIFLGIRTEIAKAWQRESFAIRANIISRGNHCTAWINYVD